MLKLFALALLLVVVAADIAPLLHLDNANVIPGSYIIILKDGLNVEDRDIHIAQLEDRLNTTNAKESEVGFRYNIGSLIGFSARLSKEMLTEQLSHENVKYIEADQVMSINYRQEARAPEAVVTQTGATWGISRVSQNKAPISLTTYVYDNVNNGNGVDVYVIDTGILTTHTQFGGRATAVYNAITGESNTDLNGHGTHCAGTIGGSTYGLARGANLKAVKVLSGSGSGSNAGVIAGVNYVTNNKVASRKSVASMSLGGGVSTALDDAVTNSIKSGVPYAIAAGNDNANACNNSPARVSGALTVGATASGDARSSFSNYGTCVNIFAPGTSITSAWIGSSNSATNTISGTSMATPHVAGVLALFWSYNTGYTQATVQAAVTNSATSGVVTNPGTGSTNLFLFSNPNH